MSKSQDLSDFPAGALDIDASGNVNVDGTVTADGLELSKASTSTSIGGSTSIAKIVNTQSTLLNETAGIEFFNRNVSGSAKLAGVYGLYEDYNVAGYAGALVFATETAGASNVAERMRIDSSGNVGIGISAPGAPLAVKGTTDGNLWVRGASAAVSGLTGLALSSVNDAASAIANMALQANNFHFVTNNTERMRIDANGHITTPAQPAFAAYSNVDVYTVSSNSPLNCNATRFNRGNHYSTAAAMFVAPVSGVYEFTFRTIYINNVTNASIGFHLNGAQYYGSLVHFTSTQGGNWKNVSTSILVNLSANDTVAPYNGGGEVTYHGNAWQEFSGKLLG